MNWAVKTQLTHSGEKLEFYSAAKPTRYNQDTISNTIRFRYNPLMLS